MNEEIKGILIKDFKEILVKEFCTDWKEKRLYIELLVNSTPFSNLLNYITNLQKEKEELQKKYLIINENNQNMQEEMVRTWKKCDDYKSRNEKAVEYIKKWGEEPDADMYMQIKEYPEYKFLLNVLEGGDE